MKITGIISTAMLSLLLGTAGPAYAQHEGEKQDHPRQQETQPAQGKPAQQHTQQQPQQNRQQPHAQPQQRPQPAQQQSRQQQARPAQQQAQQQPQQSRQQPHAQQQQRQQPNQQQGRQGQARPEQQRAQQQRGNGRPQRTQEQQRVQRSAWDGHRSQHWDTDHRNWQQRGGYRGYRIPDGRFRGYFGSGHGFRIGGLPFLLVGGYPRFQYDGYWLSLVDPWPEYWGNDWYDNDDVYVAYDNGYYLYNRRYPGTGIAISISR
jgi:hypothetical protein